MSETVYMSLWGVYLLSTGIAFWLLCILTRSQSNWRIVTRLVRVLFLVVMLTPAYLSTTPEFMAPALIVALLDFFQGYEDGAFDASINLGVAAVVSLVICIIYSLILSIVQSRKKIYR